MKNNCRKLVKNNSEQKKYLKEKAINCMSNGRDMAFHLIVELLKKTLNEITSNAISLYKNESILS